MTGTADELEQILDRTQAYLAEKLIPFWRPRLVEPKFGGFQTNYDRDGNRTGVAEKTLLANARCLFSVSHVARLGFEWPGHEQTTRQGIDFLLSRFRDPEHDGFFWIVSEGGSPIDANKVLYGHSFVLYGLAEHALLTGDVRSRAEACRVFELMHAKAADPGHGGFLEHFDRGWHPKQARGDAGLHKSLDVHMHLMEAFTALYELTGEPRHRAALEAVIELIFTRMTDPATGTGISMFTRDWTPIANVELDTVWGADRFGEQGKGIDITSYGHNIELAWLYLHALDVLGVPQASGLARVVPIFEHTRERGVDWECGGLFVEGHRAGGVTEDNKEFWQQGEALVGFLAAYRLTGDAKYLDAFRSVHSFVFTKMIHWAVGEWFPLLDRRGRVLRDYMAHNWKVCYHTLRATAQTVRRLEAILAG